MMELVLYLATLNSSLKNTNGKSQSMITRLTLSAWGYVIRKPINQLLLVITMLGAFLLIVKYTNYSQIMV
jgi:hypothetical protein